MAVRVRQSVRALGLDMKHADAAHTGTNRAHQRWMLSRMKDLILHGGDKAGMGKLREEDYVWVGQLRKKFGFVNKVSELNVFYRGLQ